MLVLNHLNSIRFEFDKLSTTLKIDMYIKQCIPAFHHEYLLRYSSCVGLFIELTVSDRSLRPL